MIGNATESAEHSANLNFFLASLEEKTKQKTQETSKPVAEKLLNDCVQQSFCYRIVNFRPERELGVMLMGSLAG